MATQIPSAPLRGVLDEFMLRHGEDRAGDWVLEGRKQKDALEKLAAAMGYASGNSAYSSIKAVLSREYVGSNRHDFDADEWVDRFLVAVDAPHLWAILVEDTVATVEPWSLAPARRKRSKAAIEATRWKTSKLTKNQVHAAYRLYAYGRDDDGRPLSLYKIADLLWQKAGYASRDSCANSLWGLFKAEGFVLRDRIAATVAASYKHGRARRHPTKGVNGSKSPGYKRFLLEQRGVFIQYCQATTVRGKPCPRPAKNGVGFCPSHDPATRERVEENLARMRASHPRAYMAMTTYESVQDALTTFAEWYGRGWSCVLSDALGVSRSSIGKYRSLPPDTPMSVARSQKILDAIATATAPVRSAA